MSSSFYDKVGKTPEVSQKGEAAMPQHKKLAQGDADGKTNSQGKVSGTSIRTP